MGQRRNASGSSLIFLLFVVGHVGAVLSQMDERLW
jgi:hypothetical protein